MGGSIIFSKIEQREDSLICGGNNNSRMGNISTNNIKNRKKNKGKVKPVDHGKDFPVVLGASDCIRGFEAGLQGIRVNEIRRILVPYQEAYGEKGKGNTIPRRADLL